MENSFLVKNIFKRNILFILLFISVLTKGQTPIDAYGNLSVSGNKIMDESGKAVQLQGMSLFWSQWEPAYYEYNTVKKLRDDWCTNIVRAAMAADDPIGNINVNANAEEQRVRTVVEAAIDLGMYVIIDFHHHHANNHTEEAVAFFSKMAQDYGHHPNIIYEIFNEPLRISWSNVIKPYSESVISAIRAHDPDNLIICGTPNWSQDVDAAADDPITSSTNIAYSLHYYAGTHGQSLRNKAVYAMNKGVALFVTEFGIVNADGGGAVDVASSNVWFEFLDQHKLSYCNWSMCDKAEGSAVLTPGTGVNDDWTNRLTNAGTFIKNRFTSNCPTYESLKDCNGLEGGSALIDNCGICAGGNTNIEPNSTCQADCNGVIDGNAFYDNCQNCVGGNTGEESCNQMPFNGTPHVIPGKIESEEYDFGGPEVGYYDTNLTNEGGSTLRNDGVDIESSSTHTNIGYTEAGEWLEYSVVVERTGDYKVEFRTASGEGNGSYHLDLDGQEIVTMNAEQFGGNQEWQAYGLQTSPAISLEAGEYKLRLIVDERGFNIDNMNFILLSITGSNLSSAENIKLYPNPVSDQLHISNLNGKNWDMYNALGVLVQSGRKAQVDMSNYPSGIYYIHIEGNVNQLVKP